MKRAFLVALCVLLLATPAYAQFGYETPDLKLSFTPEYPAPGDTVRVEAHSSLIDLNTVDVTWYVEGAVHAKGPGLSETDVVAGALGSATLIEASVVEGGVEIALAEASIQPTEIDLLWESDSYVPPFFGGRALPSAGTRLKVEALPRFKRPNGTFVPASDIVYTWRRNDLVVKAASGRGRSKASLESPSLFGTDTVSVEARSVDGTLSGYASIEVASVEPKLTLYQEHPLFGTLYHRALTSQTFIPETEMSFTAIPYFADTLRARDSDLEYAWRINDSAITVDPALPNTITINAANSSGLARIELELTSFTNFFLSVANSWGVTLRGSSGTATDPFNAE